ncbi:hypothetical protein AYK25_07385 [Thermoplasmatales archaeon SM1-50]|nr:MAG: hypothetical protein AYK25_07385 [Thermoplasmatales archaeon SM1-50]
MRFKVGLIIVCFVLVASFIPLSCAKTIYEQKPTEDIGIQNESNKCGFIIGPMVGRIRELHRITLSFYAVHINFGGDIIENEYIHLTHKIGVLTRHFICSWVYIDEGGWVV